MTDNHAKELAEWRENAKHMYERLDTISLDWPSLTCQWSSEDLDGSHAFVATDTDREEQELIKEVVVDTDKYLNTDHELKTWEVPMQKSSEKVAQDQERIRQCPSNTNYMASISSFKGYVYIWNKKNPGSKPSTVLDGHTEGGFGIDWEPLKQPVNSCKLVSGANDGKLNLWKITFKNFRDRKLIKSHQFDASINDISWTHPSQIVVSLENGHVVIFDEDLNLQKDFNCASCDINCAVLSPFCPHLLLMGTGDGRLKLWDTRTSTEVYENTAHAEGKEITACKWSPHRDGVFASAGHDSIVYIWDIKQIGREQSYEDSLDGVPELIFKHNGHVGSCAINDIDWHPLIDMLLLSSDGSNILMSWQPNSESIDEIDAEIPNYLK